MDDHIRIGTSGFSYDDWKDHFYPITTKKGDMLMYYAKHFRTVEVNATFYALPTIKTTSGMMKKVGDDFEFIIKAHQSMTHQRMKENIEKFKQGVKPLMESGQLGAILLQFPFSFHNTPHNREYLRFLVEALIPHPVVVEFRNQGWLNDATMALLREMGAGYCVVDEPALKGLPTSTVEVTSQVGYIRFHGRNKEKWWQHEKAEERYDYEYSREELIAWLPKIRQIAPAVKRLYIFFNNHPRGQAPKNAKMLEAMMKDQ